MAREERRKGKKMNRDLEGRRRRRIGEIPRRENMKEM